MAAAATFPVMLALTIVASAVWTPSSIIADAAVMAAADHVGGWGQGRALVAVVGSCWLQFPC